MHSDYASSLNNIGSAYDSKGDYDKALEYYLKSREIQNIVLG
jgi:tetratricopeptide (TPR) repeat protein